MKVKGSGERFRERKMRRENERKSGEKRGRGERRGGGGREAKVPLVGA
jgi:hypothetical protein